ncbi:MAG: LmbE family protein [Candidatus Moranbacteria bacterium GW2011_GWC2_37_8]|nr:MAG: LmbE family protein [Candidatus Moranbacteria bacterium GW2011_GWC2_37_8]KKQ60476.1 MAG: Bacillithiol biosynthesis deacetylase BshB2 [Parcubacteria group bacterium GW2011_GWC1_38_22]KKQ80095.1 MAG: LmbE family protein [Candidatus Moranbacteria bacterium GW2011_GWD2_38_7]
MKILCVFPHPDDETIFAGGTILRHIKSGDEVIWICASLGGRGGNSQRRSSKIFYYLFSLIGKFPALLVLQKVAVYWLGIFRRKNMKLAKIRKQEAENVAGIFGMEKVIFLEISDMRFGWDKKMINQKIKANLEKLQPDVVYTLHPNGVTGHPDHVALSRYVTEAIKDMEGRAPRLRYITFSKEIARKYKLPLLGISENDISEKIELSLEELKIKRQVIEVYQSQNYLWGIFLEKYPELLQEEYFLELV